MEMHLGKFITGALISAMVAIGGVWFVVDMALRGVEGNIATTNIRINDLRTDITSRLDRIEQQMLEQFRSTRDEINRRAELPSDPKAVQLAAYTGHLVFSADGQTVAEVIGLQSDKSRNTYSLIMRLDASVSPERVIINMDPDVFVEKQLGTGEFGLVTSEKIDWSRFGSIENPLR